MELVIVISYRALIFKSTFGLIRQDLVALNLKGGTYTKHTGIMNGADL